MIKRRVATLDPPYRVRAIVAPSIGCSRSSVAMRRWDVFTSFPCV